MKIKLYTMDSCGHCHDVKRELESMGVEYEEINPIPLEMFHRAMNYGLKMAPIFEIDGKIMGKVDGMAHVKKNFTTEDE